MTSFPVTANHDHWWLTTQPLWNRLHAYPADALDRNDEDAVEALCCGPWPVLEAVCGLEKPVTMPGVFSRLGMPRCGHCCRKLAIGSGNGAPANEKAREPRGAMVKPYMKEARP